LIDHLRRGTVDLSAITTLVLDEADLMLEMGFLEDVEYILRHVPRERVTAMFSATMPDPIIQLAHRHLRKPEMLRLSQAQALTVPEINQVFYDVPPYRKVDALCRVLDAKRPERALVFCATKRMVDDLVETLQGHGYLADCLHGDMSQAARDKSLRAFRAGQTEVLIATDVAARGLDIPEVSHVVNFDIPPDAEYYVHRIGRTGRFGRTGEAITFVTTREFRELKVIERATGAKIRRQEVPTETDVEEREAKLLEERLLEVLARGQLGRYRAVIEDLIDEHDPVDLATAALTMAAAGRGRPRAKAAHKAG
jgi:ATP-dependent RNA helicase DeaD